MEYTNLRTMIWFGLLPARLVANILFSLQTKSGDELYGTLFSSHYCGRLNAAGNIDNSLTVGCRKHWYLLFEEKDYRVDKGVLHCWIRQNSDTVGVFILSELWEMATYG